MRPQRCTPLFISSLLLIAGCVFSTLPASAADTSNAPQSPATQKVQRLDVQPREFVLHGQRQTLQLVVTGHLADEDVIDATRIATYEASQPGVVDISPSGQVTPINDGAVDIIIRSGDSTATVRVQVTGQTERQPVSFEQEALAALAKTGCSGGACHGAPNGKAGFRLSLFGFEPDFDRQSLARQARSRRVNTIEPAKSLLLRKPTMEVPHAGGRRFQPGDELYSLLHDWIGEGCRVDPPQQPCVGIEIFPSVSRVLRFPDAEQQLSVRAKFDDGSVRDVTHLSQFTLSDPDVAGVSADGLVTGYQRGETAVIVRYLNFIETPLLTFVQDIGGFEWPSLPEFNFVDTHVDRKLRQLQFQPSEQCSDEVFVRRVYLDVLGILPTPEEYDRFLSSPATDKRARLIDELLERPEYALFWAQKWGDLLRVSRKQIGINSVFKYSRWLEAALASNMPYDQFAQELLSATGSTLVNPAGNYYRTAADTLDAMETSAQLFLGTRIQCAKCHNHPFERWTQNNYYGMAAFFNRVQRHKTGHAEEVVLFSTREGEIHHPASGRVMQPWVPVNGELPVSTNADRRSVFTTWLTSKDNPYFARVEVNRIWAQVMGRGIVEPFDDFRDSNPPANAPLLTALADDFVRNDFDRKQTLRTILNSRAYQSKSRPNEFNRDDEKYFSHYLPRRLTAEQIVDALGQVTGQPERFDLVSADTKATWLPAPDLKPHDRSKIGDIDFLKVFGQPERQSACECDRGDDSSLGQALELLNGNFINRQLTHPENRLHRELRDGKSTREIIVGLYRRALSRQPTDTELQVSLDYVASHADKSVALEDVCWAVVNKDEFLFQH
ncbi:MAG: DUF1549 domain-containing protein [Planctomycetota bacterium]|jgi:hypothetical protein